ncbi:hypothetical protein [Methylocella tundrae]|uniref:Protein of unassigned function n=1 Tax=Methylocella tundrae TaxID=227605 RepID=A0A4U8YYZ0_METTU|nr:hypothetical protein [Methylocella tundrae]WPP05809.1 hypothetical protein SIN04_08370 [Methylocella tundrae]VFU08323.1 Protein of unassigned function [Methylocella tundrae]
MTAMDRRAMLGTLLGGAAVAAFGLALTPGLAEAAPLMMGKELDAPTENLIEKTVVVVHRRPRRRVCWWHRGRRVCRWR